MKRHYGMFLLALLVVALLLLSTVAYTVDFTEYALIKTFGQTTARIDGRRAGRTEVQVALAHPAAGPLRCPDRDL